MKTLMDCFNSSHSLEHSDAVDVAVIVRRSIEVRFRTKKKMGKQLVLQ
ncbi:hypothetical protein QR98_0091410 [Sarcoptes scabiei]|uniref:Uncharacterized protein n=1 Tax=Sarcoptes scabiei TaxID=52283 RepID=A0A132AHV6_SARSC|nr:hypothetical protein QR98_0091410 [Sarcoptes scabiei]